MTRNCLKPIEWEKVQNGLGINLIIDKMLTKHKQDIHDQIQKFLDAGGELHALNVNRYEDGTLILRADQRTVVTVHVSVEGRKVGGAEFELVSED